jgi:DNA invertase Pin-like site-specific DNA recombinase
MSESKLKGKRYICLVRASHGTQEISTDAQLRLLHAAVEEEAMTFVDAKIVDGLTGSLPGKRKDLEELLERKRTKNDFDVLVLQRCDRLTRGGLKHGFWFEWECQKLGIEVLIVGDSIPDGEYGDLVKFIKYQAAKEQAFSISQRSTQGSQFALEQGRIIPSSRTPFGCWRLYYTADGKPSHIIRNIGDGRQEKLDPVTHAVIDTYGIVGGGSKGHYRKQKDEKPLLMPGDTDKADAVREIFRLHYMEGFCGKRIADVLNRKGICSPMGKKWGQHQVESIYNSEVYTGRAVCNRTSNAIYHQRRKHVPKKVELDAQTYATARGLKVEMRPLSEWEIKDEPLMKDFLDSAVRERAVTAHEARWARLGDPNRPKQLKSKHRGSDYLLSELFYAKQDGGKLTGIPCGPKHKKVRYYRHRRQNVGYEKGSIYNGMFPAAPLVQAIVGIIAAQIQDLPKLREQIIQMVVEQSALLAMDFNKFEDLRKRREQVRARTQMLVSTLDAATLADAKPEIDRLSAERRDLDEQIAVAEAAALTAATDPQQAADCVIEWLKSLPSDWQTMPPFALREVVGTFIERALGDMATKDVEVRLRLPLWAFSAQNADSAMRLEDGLRSQMFYETHSLALGTYDCRYLLRASRACYDCRRRSAA